MLLIRVLNDLEWIFNIEERMQLVKTIRWGFHIDICEKKIANSFGIGWKKVFFLMNHVKFTEKFINEIKIDEKWSVDGFLTIFYLHHWTYLIKMLHSSTHMTIFGLIFFLIKKVAKLVETQKFWQQYHNQIISDQGSYSYFFDKINIWKIRILVSFLVGF